MENLALVDQETANLAATVAIDSVEFRVVLSPEERALYKCVQAGKTVQQLSKDLQFPEEQIREAIVDAVNRLALYAVALRRGRQKAAREAEY